MVNIHSVPIGGACVHDPSISNSLWSYSFELTYLSSDSTPAGLVYEPYQSTSGQDRCRHEERVGQRVSGVRVGYEHNPGEH